MISDDQYSFNGYSIFHLKVARLVMRCIDCSNWERLAYLLKKLNQDDRESLHYAFFELYGFDYDLKIRKKVGSYENLKKLGLAPSFEV